MQFKGGLPETVSGGGSTLAATENLRRELPRIFKENGIRHIVDAPCGDFNWMAHVDLSGKRYVGIDYSNKVLTRAYENAKKQKAEFHPKVRTFISADIMQDDLAPFDLLICRDFFQHFPNARVWAALANMIRSGATYLFATSHSNEVNEDLAKPGGFRPLNLEKAPFNLPPPLDRVDDPPGSGRIMGLWRLDDLRMLS